MTKRPDKTLMEIDARYSYRPAAGEVVSWEEIRQRSREWRVDLVGRHADQVQIEENHLARLYNPTGASNAEGAQIVYIHGGGWCKGDQVTHGSIMTDLAALSGLPVHGLSYPLAPEHPYPAAIDAVCEKIDAIVSMHAGPLILAGDSAGANLALAAALRFRDEGKGLPLVALLLWYGCYRFELETRSHQAYGDGSCGLATAGMRQMWEDYVAEQNDVPYADLSDADFSSLPPIYLSEAECDCLADETRWLAGRLIEDEVAHFYDFYPGAIHGFIHFSAEYDPGYKSLKQAAQFARMLLSK